MPNHFISRSCAGERCGVCSREGKSDQPATHKLGEEIPADAPSQMGWSHNLTEYVCCRHFAMIVSPKSAAMFRGCRTEPNGMPPEQGDFLSLLAKCEAYAQGREHCWFRMTLSTLSDAGSAWWRAWFEGPAENGTTFMGDTLPEALTNLVKAYRL